MHVPDQLSPAQVCTYQTSSLQHKCARTRPAVSSTSVHATADANLQPCSQANRTDEEAEKKQKKKRKKKKEAEVRPAHTVHTAALVKAQSEHNGTRKHAAYVYYIANRCLVAAKRSRQSAQRHYTTSISAHSEHRFLAPSSRKDVVNQCL